MKLSSKKLEALKEEIALGEKGGRELAREYGVDLSTVYYHKRNLGISGKRVKEAKALVSKPVKRRSLEFIDMPMVSSSSPRVMVLICDVSQVRSLVGELWK